MTCGIYKIVSPSGNCYVGSSRTIEVRWASHRHGMRHGVHHCQALNHVGKKYEIGDLKWEILEECEEDVLIDREQFWMDQLHPVYNSCKTATGTSPLARKLAREHMLVLNQQPWSKARRDLARDRFAKRKPWERNKPWTDERRAAQSARMVVRWSRGEVCTKKKEPT